MSTKLVLSREEKIQTLEARIENFKKALQDPKTFTFSLYQSNTPKKDYIRAWGDALADILKLQGKEDETYLISTRITQELERLGLSSGKELVRKSLPFKYKDSAKIHAKTLLDYEYKESRGNDYREKTPEEIEKINWPHTEEHYKNIALLEKCIEFEKTHELVTFIPPTELNEMKTRQEASRQHLFDVMDSRNVVLPSYFALLMMAHTESTKNGSFSYYMKYIRKIVDITSKQAVKLLTGRVSKVDVLYDPKNRIDAKRSGFYGVMCGECGDWKVDLKYHTDLNADLLFCYACKNWNELKTEKLVSKMI